MNDEPTPAGRRSEREPQRQARRLRPWRAVALVFVLVLAVVVGGAAWLLGTRPGLDAAVALAQRATGGALRIDGAQGRILGPLRIDALRYHTPDLRLNLEALELDWHAAPLLQRRLVVDRLGVARMELARRSDEAPADAPTPPDDLQLPLQVEVRSLTLGRFDLRQIGTGPGSSGEAASDVVTDAARQLDEAADTMRNAADTVEAAVETAAGQGFWLADLRAAIDSDGRRHALRALNVTLPQGRLMVDGRIDGLAPFALEASGRFDGELDGRAFEARLTVGETLLAPRIVAEASAEGLTAHAELRAAPFEHMPLRALKLAAGELDPAVFVAGAPRAALSIKAELAAVEGTATLLAGPIRLTNRSPATADAGGLPLVSLAGILDWTQEAIAVDALDIRLPGEGRVSGHLQWRPPRAATGESALQSGFGQLAAALELAGIDMRSLDGRLPRQQLAGRVDAEGDAQRQQAVLALALGAARIDARAELSAVNAEAGTDGSTAGEPLRSFMLNAAVRKLDPRAWLADAPQAQLNLDLDASGELAEQGGLPRTLAATFSIPDSRLEGLALDGKGRVRVEGTRLPELELDLQLAGNTLRADGAWGGPGDALNLALDASRLDALGHGLGGRAGATGRLRGTLAVPAGELQFFGEALRLPGSVRLLGVNGAARLEAGADGPFQLSAGLTGLGPLGTDGDGVALPDWLASARVSASGTRARHELEVVLQTPARDEGADSLALGLQGGLEQVTQGQPGPRWVGELRALETAGRFVSRLVAPARLSLSPTAVSLGAAELSAGDNGRIRLDETSWSPRKSVARGSLTGLSFGLVSRPDGRPRRGPGPLVLGASWDLSMGDTLDGQLRVFREAGDLTVEGEIRTRLGLEALEAVLSARGDLLALTADARGSEFGRVQANAALRARRTAEGQWTLPPDTALSGAAELDMPSITWLGRLMRENVETAGRLQGRIELAGTLDAPLASGRLDGRELQVALVDQGLILSGGEFTASFDSDRVRLERLAFVSPNRVRPRESRIPFERLTTEPGRFTASGEVLLDSGAGSFRFAADRLPLLQRDDRWMILSGQGTAHSSWNSLTLDADFRADAGYIELAETLPPSLSDDVVVLGRDEVRSGTFAVEADVRVGLGDALYLSAMGLETRLAGDLRLRLRPGQALSAVGTISTVGGSYRGYGQNLVIDRGVVNFQGALDAPGLNIVALRKGLAVEAGVAVTGSAKRPQVRLVSEPNVPDPEKLSWIVLGRAPDAGAGADLGLLLPAAQALLGGPGGGMTDELSRSLGFDSFSIGQGELNSTSRAATSRVVGGGSTIASGPSVSGQVLSLGKRLGTDLFLSFEQSLGGAETLLKLSYQLSRRLSLVARGGTDNSLDLYYSFSFR
ncbi:MAG: translocation/assembly module TamB domain-containing protein [Thauera propionica]|jgi:translocation and assembly module TamB|nr:translocation/assembly module TamB domain-containing protein [Thauera propionica]